jgi:signal transduction histidine kinase
MRLGRKLIRRSAHLRLPRRTVRLRLTLLYGALFLVSGAALLAITYVLVRHATGDSTLYKGPDGTFGRLVGSPSPSSSPPTQRHWGSGTVNQQFGGDETLRQRFGDGEADQGLTSQQVQSQARLLQDRALRQNEAQRHQLLTQSGIALAIMAVISIALGWIVAGRILRRLRTITAAAKDISANSLHERLALDGPGDELKELGDTFDELLARLEASFHAQRQFIANASHELRTPLARQRTIAQVALSDPDATVESLRAAHERVLAAGAQQERLIAALLTLARGQAGLDVREPFDLARLADEVVATRSTEAAQRSLEVRKALSPAPAAGDPRLAERLTINLVDNALRHNVAHGRVDVVTGTRDGRPFLSVTNTGPEIPVTAIDRLFHPFQRLGSERTGRREGLGLGLSIVQAIATAHGATIDARPHRGGGLAVKVTFPVPDIPSDRGRVLTAHASPDVLANDPALTGGSGGFDGAARSRA